MKQNYTIGFRYVFQSSLFSLVNTNHLVFENVAECIPYYIKNHTIPTRNNIRTTCINNTYSQFMST